MTEQGSNRGMFPEFDAAFGHRLAGFVDGEGHFGIVRTRKPSGSVGYSVIFAVHIRDDDTFMLERLHQITGLGVIYNSGPRATAELDNKPVAMWRVWRKADCLRLVDIFETYPLWTTKAHDFHIWAKAVRYLNSDKPEGWEPMARWFDEIRAVREYGSSELPASYDVDTWTLFDDIEESE